MSGYGNPNGGRANSGRNSGAREPAFSGSVDRIGYIGIIEYVTKPQLLLVAVKGHGRYQSINAPKHVESSTLTVHIY